MAAGWPEVIGEGADGADGAAGGGAPLEGDAVQLPDGEEIGNEGTGHIVLE